MSGGTEKRWRTVVRRAEGRIVLRSPDGREWLGTAREVREAAMTPWRRRELADGLRTVRLTTEPRTDERSWIAVERRQRSIRETEVDAKMGATRPAYLPAALAITAEAAARSAKLDFDAFVERAVEEAIIRETKDAAERGIDGLEYTRHEQAALGRLGRQAAQGKKGAKQKRVDR